MEMCVCVFRAGRGSVWPSKHVKTAQLTWRRSFSVKPVSFCGLLQWLFPAEASFSPCLRTQEGGRCDAKKQRINNVEPSFTGFTFKIGPLVTVTWSGNRSGEGNKIEMCFSSSFRGQSSAAANFLLSDMWLCRKLKMKPVVMAANFYLYNQITSSTDNLSFKIFFVVSLMDCFSLLVRQESSKHRGSFVNK